MLPESILKKKPPEFLYHYTSIAGVYGIVDNRSLRMTDIDYLNDNQEYIYAASLLIHASRESESIRNDRLLTALFNRLSDLPICPAPQTVFVFSFSEEPDLLSQWRGYCRGTGYSVGFKSALLVPFLERQSLLLAPCVYEPEAQHDIIQTVLSRIEEKAKTQFTDPDATIDTNMLTPFYQVAPFIKHPKFSEEKEWRIVTKEVVEGRRGGFRLGSSMLIPYIDATIDPSSPDLFPIKKIIVGPSPEQELAMKSVGGVFGIHNFACSTTRSEIPYREIRD